MNWFELLIVVIFFAIWTMQHKINDSLSSRLMFLEEEYRKNEIKDLERIMKEALRNEDYKLAHECKVLIEKFIHVN